MNGIKSALIMLVMLIACTAIANAKKSEDKALPHRVEWMAEGSYGLMVHYLMYPQGATPEARTAELNRMIDGFNLDGFMKQFKESGADWLIFTIGQNSGYYNSSNAVIDTLLPGRTPKRDLVMEIARRVKGMGKHFISYMTVEVAGQAPEVKEAFAWNPDDQSHFLKRYIDFVRAYSVKLGPLNDGWWFDGWYEPVTHGKWDPRDWQAATRAGNPDSLIAFNDTSLLLGMERPVVMIQDYLAGEVHMLYKGQIVFDFVPYAEQMTMDKDGNVLIRGAGPKLYMPKSRFVDGIQWHALVPIDSTFNPAIPKEMCHYSDKDLFGFVLGCKKVGGAVTLNALISPEGRILHETAAQLDRLGKTIRGVHKKD